MTQISVSAEIAGPILQQLKDGTLELHGIGLRDAVGKQIRYVLKGVETLPADSKSLENLPSLESLRAAVGVTQLLQVVTVAQTAAVLVSLAEIQKRLAAIERRLDGIETRLSRIETRQSLVIEALRSAPLARLKAAKVAAQVARQHGDRTALIAAGKDAQQATHDLLEQARHLVRVEENGLPVAVLLPDEVADLADSAFEAATIASAIWLALDSTSAASAIMIEVGGAFDDMRQRLAAAVIDPDRMLQRIAADTGDDHRVMAAGGRLRMAALSALGRGTLIEQGLIAGDPDGLEFERAAPVDEISVVPIQIRDH